MRAAAGAIALLAAGCLEGELAGDPPIALAAFDAGACTIAGVTAVQLDAAGSMDPDGRVVEYLWEFTAYPSGLASAPPLDAPTSPTPSFLPPLPGTYTLVVTVTDGWFSTTSAPVSIETEVPDELALVIAAGDGQTGTVDTVLDDVLAVRVESSCGAVPGVDVTWLGESARPQGGSTSTTGADGIVTTGVMLGKVAGPQHLIAMLTAEPATAVTFELTAEADAPDAVLLLDPGDGIPASSTTPTVLQLVVVDQHLNPTGTDATFGANIEQGAAEAYLDADGDGVCEIGEPRQVLFLTTSGGTGSIGVCSPIAGDVYLEVRGKDLGGVGVNTLFFSDLETDSPRFAPSSAWQRGVPTYPADLAGFTGAVFATELDGPAQFPGDGVADLTLDASHDFDLEVARVNSVYLDVTHFHRLGFDDEGCSSGAIVMQGNQALDPEDKYSGTSPCSSWPSFLGQRSRTGPARFLTDHDVEPTFTFRVSQRPDTDAAGWYVDDVRLWALVDFTRVRFL